MNTTSQPTPTQRWRATVPELPALTTAGADTAERLLLHAHYAIDWTSWIKDYRHRYWDHLLPQRIENATYRSDSLYTWWSLVCKALNAAPQYPDRRAEIAQLMAQPAAPTLTALRDNLPALLLRVRIIAEAVAAQRNQADS